MAALPVDQAANGGDMFNMGNAKLCAIVRCIDRHLPMALFALAGYIEWCLVPCREPYLFHRFAEVINNGLCQSMRQTGTMHFLNIHVLAG
jgi:hypothetical protein